MDIDEIKKLIDDGDYGKAGHALFEMAHKKGSGVHTDDDTPPSVPGGDSGDNGPRPTGGNGGGH